LWLKMSRRLLAEDPEVRLTAVRELGAAALGGRRGLLRGSLTILGAGRRRSAPRRCRPHVVVRRLNALASGDLFRHTPTHWRVDRGGSGRDPPRRETRASFAERPLMAASIRVTAMAANSCAMPCSRGRTNAIVALSAPRSRATIHSMRVAVEHLSGGAGGEPRTCSRRSTSLGCRRPGPPCASNRRRRPAPVGGSEVGRRQDHTRSSAVRSSHAALTKEAPWHARRSMSLMELAPSSASAFPARAPSCNVVDPEERATDAEVIGPRVSRRRCTSLDGAVQLDGMAERSYAEALEMPSARCRDHAMSRSP
jgi:hypothetical protein